MINEIVRYFYSMRAEWFVLGAMSAMGISYRHLIKAINQDRIKARAIAQGVEALLRDRIIDSFHKYEEKGVCPVYAKENVKRLYVPYHRLGGNDIATEFVEKMLEMPTGGK